ncbi:MAG: Ig-like domain-containing protein [Gemmatimonadetes bacterium]|nr:Ig-like domain-containing protein [Gemmatimonadota bacterium]
MIISLAAPSACHEITLNPDHVVALEIANTTPKVPQGDTLRLVARALNAAGQPVAGAQVTWAVLDTAVVAFQLDPSGLVTGISPGSGKVQAAADNLRTDPILVTVTQVPSPLSPLPDGRGERVRRDGVEGRSQAFKSALPSPSPVRERGQG